MNQKVAKYPKVMHIVSGLHVGGAEMMLYRLLSHSRIQNTLVVSLNSHGELTKQIRQIGIDVIELDRGSLFITLKQLNVLIDQYHPTVLQSWLYRADLLAALAGWRKKVPVVWNVRQTEVGWVNSQAHIWWVQRLNAVLSRFLPKKIVYCAQAAKESHHAIGYASRKAEVIGNGIDIEKFTFHESVRRSQRQEWNIYNNDILIGMVGRFDPLKNHARFFRIFKQVTDLYSKGNIKGVLIGRGINAQNNELMQDLGRYGLSEKIILIDELTDVVPAYSAMDIHLLTSDNEGWPNVLAEAMSMGLPCVCTYVVDAKKILYDVTAAISINSEKQFSEKVIEYIKLSVNERWKLAKMNREKIQKKSSLQSTVDRYDDLYLNLKQ